MKLKCEFSFDAAHRLVGYEGQCSNLHGHIWRVVIEVEGNNLNDIGILWDFTNVKKIKNQFDHKTILKNCVENHPLIFCLYETCNKDSVYKMKNNPTAENLAYEILYLCLTENPNLKYIIKVYESPKSYVEVSG